MNTYEQITAIMAEQKEWSLRNFGPTTPDNINNPLLGVIEELGELAKAVLKTNQGIRGTSQKHNDAAVDAIGDMQIFVIDAMNRRGVGISEQDIQYLVGEIRLPAEIKDPFFFLSFALNKYVRKALNDPDDLLPVLAVVWLFARLLDIDPLDALFVTWRTTVSQRDWIANPDTGVPPQEIVGLPDLVDNSEVLRRAHEDGIIHLTGEHFRILEQISENHKFAEKTCREITQAHYAQLLEGGLV